MGRSLDPRFIYEEFVIMKDTERKINYILIKKSIKNLEM